MTWIEYLTAWSPAINLCLCVIWFTFWFETQRNKKKMRKLLLEIKEVAEKNKAISEENARIVSMWENVTPEVTPTVENGVFKWIVTWKRQLH